MQSRDFLSVVDLSREEVEQVFDSAERFKQGTASDAQSQALKGYFVALIFQKPSLRTRVSFELAVKQLGGYPVVLSQADIALNQRESAKDIARNLERWVDMLVARVFAHRTLVELADYAKIPVINALSDQEHPCQALADLFTLREHFGDVQGRHLVFVGNGFNVAHSLLLLSTMLGVHITVTAPPGYEPSTQVVKQAQELGRKSGSRVAITNEHLKAVETADAIYTDVWVSMGQEEETAKRLKDFAPYQVNASLLNRAPLHAVVMHCLPAHRGREITDEVLDSPACLALQQAENRLHVQKALLSLLSLLSFRGGVT